MRLAGLLFNLLLRFNRILMQKTQLINITRRKLSIRNYSPRTINSYISAIRHFADWLLQDQLKTITNDSLDQYLYHLKQREHRSISSMKQAVAALKFIYSDVLEKDIPSALNLKFRAEQKIPVVLSENEVTRLLNSIKNLKHKSILMTIYSAGLRLGELLSLRIKDVDFDRNLLVVKKGKGNKDRHTVLSKSLKSILNQYLQQYHPKDYLFEGQNGGKYSASSVQAVMRKAVNNAGIKKHATVHTLRHSFATHLHPMR